MKKDRATREIILEEQKILKKEPEFINASSWSYYVTDTKQTNTEQTKDHKPTHRKPKKRKPKPKSDSKQ